MLVVEDKIGELIENKERLKKYKESIIKSNPFNYFKFYQQLFTNSKETVNLVLNNETFDISDIHYDKTSESEYYSHMTNVPPNSQLNLLLIEEYVNGLYDNSPIKIVKYNDKDIYYIIGSNDIISTSSNEYIIPKLICINEDLYKIHTQMNTQRKRTISN